MLIWIYFFFSDTPLVSTPKSIVNTQENSDAELYCNYESSTESRVIWQKNGKLLPNLSGQDQTSKFSVVYGQPKGSKSYSSLFVRKVKPSDLGQYECQVANNMGAENVTIELTFYPEPPRLQKIETDGQYTITHWHIRSLQPLTEVMLNYRQKDVS